MKGREGNLSPKERASGVPVYQFTLYEVTLQRTLLARVPVTRENSSVISGWVFQTNHILESWLLLCSSAWKAHIYPHQSLDSMKTVAWVQVPAAAG